MVIATNVGSFPEYITDSENGLLAEPTADSVADKILEALHNNRYRQLEQKVVSTYCEKTGNENGQTILSAYMA